MNEFLAGLSSGQPLLWAVFVPGAVATAALSLTAFWGAVFRASEVFRRKKPPEGGDNVLS